MFKGFDKAKDIQYVYTPVFSSLCGVKLDYNNKAGYLLSGICVCHISFYFWQKQYTNKTLLLLVMLYCAQQEVCGEMEEFLLVSVTWWSPGTTCHSPKKRISTTDTRLAVNVGWVMILHIIQDSSWNSHLMSQTFILLVPDGARSQTQ